MNAESVPQSRKDKLHHARGQKRVDTFKVSLRGFRKIFAKHFGADNPGVETIAYHLAQVETSLPNTREAIRLARYPNAGNRNPKRFALGLQENLAVLESHLRRANEALEELARGGNGRPSRRARKAADDE